MKTTGAEAIVAFWKHMGVRYLFGLMGNTDFLNMLNRDRLASKKESKTEAVQSVAGDRIDDENIHVGPSDYVAWPSPLWFWLKRSRHGLRYSLEPSRWTALPHPMDPPCRHGSMVNKLRRPRRPAEPMG